MLKHPDRGAYLGKHIGAEGEMFNWYVADTSEGEAIAVQSNTIAAEADAFVKDIFLRTFTLQLNPKIPYIVRKCLNGFDVTVTENRNPGQMIALIHGIKERRLKYLFQSSSDPNGASP